MPSVYCPLALTLRSPCEAPLSSSEPARLAPSSHLNPNTANPRICSILFLPAARWGQPGSTRAAFAPSRDHAPRRISALACRSAAPHRRSPSSSPLLQYAPFRVRGGWAALAQPFPSLPGASCAAAWGLETPAVSCTAAPPRGVWEPPLYRQYRRLLLRVA